MVVEEVVNMVVVQRLKVKKCYDTRGGERPRARRGSFSYEGSSAVN